ncbi:MAG: hypothetical protein AB1758_35220, partial [Candidatus Eremiobacterota bacterium]
TALPGPFTRATLSLDERFLLTAGPDRVFRLWELDWELAPRPATPSTARPGILRKILSTLGLGRS